MKLIVSGLCAAGVMLALAAPVAAEVPTTAVCKSFAKYAIRWNTEARGYKCKLPKGANAHFREGDIYKWCMARPNEDRSPQALGHKELLMRSCPTFRRAG